MSAIEVTGNRISTVRGKPVQWNVLRLRVADVDTGNVCAGAQTTC